MTSVFVPTIDPEPPTGSGIIMQWELEIAEAKEQFGFQAVDRVYQRFHDGAPIEDADNPDSLMILMPEYPLFRRIIRVSDYERERTLRAEQLRSYLNQMPHTFDGSSSRFVSGLSARSLSAWEARRDLMRAKNDWALLDLFFDRVRIEYALLRFRLFFWAKRAGVSVNCPADSLLAGACHT